MNGWALISIGFVLAALFGAIVITTIVPGLTDVRSLLLVAFTAILSGVTYFVVGILRVTGVTEGGKVAHHEDITTDKIVENELKKGPLDE